MTSDTINLGDMLEFTPIELDEATAQVFRDVSEMREKITVIMARQAGIPWKLTVPSDQQDATLRALSHTVQSKWGKAVMSHVLPPQEQDE